MGTGLSRFNDHAVGISLTHRNSLKLHHHAGLQPRFDARPHLGRALIRATGAVSSDH